jgi:hypothetical protein
MSATDEELGAMQQQLLVAALAGTPLAGRTEAVNLPDIGFVKRGPSVILLDENLHGAMRSGGASGSVRLVSRADVSLARTQIPNAAFLQFAPAEVGSDTVRLTLQARLIESATQGELGLSTVQVEFRKSPEGWTPESPVYSAN